MNNFISFINIDGHTFMTNDEGMFNLTEIWTMLNLPRAKAPSEWRTKAAKRLLSTPQKMRVWQPGFGAAQTYGNQEAVIKYAGWISEEFEDMVYASFEALLTMPDVQYAMADRMVELGHEKAAKALQRQRHYDLKDSRYDAHKAMHRLWGSRGRQ
ncbi:KilA-N domain-containing protein [Kluyvera ascorbata]|uniref:KilA-N domain-containing protein n=1 Tax=Kluyvera ascorbata TaxID=51288 RepID=UPI0039F5F6A8